MGLTEIIYKDVKDFIVFILFFVIIVIWGTVYSVSEFLKSANFIELIILIVLTFHIVASIYIRVANKVPFGEAIFFKVFKLYWAILKFTISLFFLFVGFYYIIGGYEKVMILFYNLVDNEKWIYDKGPKWILLILTILFLIRLFKGLYSFNKVYINHFIMNISSTIILSMIFYITYFRYDGLFTTWWGNLVSGFLIIFCNLLYYVCMEDLYLELGKKISNRYIYSTLMFTIIGIACIGRSISILLIHLDMI